MNKETREKVKSLIVPDEELILKTKEKALLQSKRTNNYKSLIRDVAAVFIVIFSVCLLVLGNQNSEAFQKLKTDYLKAGYELTSDMEMTDEVSESISSDSFYSSTGSVYCFDINHKQVYSSISEIYSDDKTLLVVKGSVIKTESIIINGYVYTRATLAVEEVLKGFEKEKQISFIEYGGCIDGEKAKRFFGNEIYSLSEYSVIYNMYNYSAVGDEVIVFLQSINGELSLQSKTDYCIAACFEGKFELVKNGYRCASSEYFDERYNYLYFKNLT